MNDDEVVLYHHLCICNMYFVIGNKSIMETRMRWINLMERRWMQIIKDRCEQERRTIDIINVASTDVIHDRLKKLDDMDTLVKNKVKSMNDILLSTRQLVDHHMNSYFIPQQCIRLAHQQHTLKTCTQNIQSLCRIQNILPPSTVNTMNMNLALQAIGTIKLKHEKKHLAQLSSVYKHNELIVDNDGKNVTVDPKCIDNKFRCIRTHYPMMEGNYSWTLQVSCIVMNCITRGITRPVIDLYRCMYMFMCMALVYYIVD